MLGSPESAIPVSHHRCGGLGDGRAGAADPGEAGWCPPHPENPPPGPCRAVSGLSDPLTGSARAPRGHPPRQTRLAEGALVLGVTGPGRGPWDLGKVIHPCWGRSPPCAGQGPALRSPSARIPSAAAALPGSRSATPRRPGSRGWPGGGRPRPPPPCGWPGNDITMVRAGPVPARRPARRPQTEAPLVQMGPAAFSAPPSSRTPRSSCTESLLVTQSPSRLLLTRLQQRDQLR